MDTPELIVIALIIITTLLIGLYYVVKFIINKAKDTEIVRNTRRDIEQELEINFNIKRKPKK